MQNTQTNKATTTSTATTTLQAYVLLETAHTLFNNNDNKLVVTSTIVNLNSSNLEYTLMCAYTAHANMYTNVSKSKHMYAVVASNNKYANDVPATVYKHTLTNKYYITLEAYNERIDYLQQHVVAMQQHAIA